MRPDGNTCPEQDRPFPHLPPDALNPGMLDAAIFHRERFGSGDGSILRSTEPIAMLVSLTRCRTPCFQAATIAIAATCAGGSRQRVRSLEIRCTPDIGRRAPCT